jgi:hypothetical protein
MPRPRALALLALAAALAGASCRTPAASSDAPPAVVAAPPPGVFAWRDIRGGEDKIDAFKDLRDRVIGLFEAAAKFPGESGQPSPAAREVVEIKKTFDDQHAPEELSARIEWFDRAIGYEDHGHQYGHATEGLEVRLRRAPLHDSASELRVVVQELVLATSVSGQPNDFEFGWLSDGSRVALDLRVNSDVKRTEFGESVDSLGGEHYLVRSPEIALLLARAQADVYDPLSGPAFSRLVRDGVATMRARSHPPAHSSFYVVPAKGN